MSKYKYDTLYQMEISAFNTPYYLRGSIDKFELLKESIKQFGQLVPIIFSSFGINNLRIISGHRRFLAMKELGYTTINGLYRGTEYDNPSDRNDIEYFLTENMHRESLSSLEVARNLKIIKEKMNYTYKELSVITGLHPDTLKEYVNIDSLSDKMKEIYAEKKIPKRTLSNVARLPSKDQEDFNNEIGGLDGKTMTEITALLKLRKNKKVKSKSMDDEIAGDINTLTGYVDQMKIMQNIKRISNELYSELCKLDPNSTVTKTYIDLATKNLVQKLKELGDDNDASLQ